MVTCKALGSCLRSLACFGLLPSPKSDLSAQTPQRSLHCTILAGSGSGHTKSGGSKSPRNSSIFNLMARENLFTNPGTTPITILAVNSDHGLSLPGRKLGPWSEVPFLYRFTVLLNSGGSNSPWSEFWSEFPHFMGMGVVPAPSNFWKFQQFQPLGLNNFGNSSIFCQGNLQFPNAVVLNAVGRRSTQMRAKERKWVQRAQTQKSAKERKRGAKGCKRALPRKKLQTTRFETTRFGNSQGKSPQKRWTNAFLRWTILGSSRGPCYQRDTRNFLLIGCLLLVICLLIVCKLSSICLLIIC